MQRGVLPNSPIQNTLSSLFPMGASSSKTNSSTSSISTAPIPSIPPPPRAAPIPPLLYGTAWKKDRTAQLVELAIRTGFRGIDTACQPKHYFEPGVGEALKELYAEGVVSRSDIFLQTKYTPLAGQDLNNIPYDRSVPLQEQVRQSFRVSQQNLGTDYVDSLVLHSPLPTLNETLTVWHEFEAIHTAGGALRLGISNCYDLRMLQGLYTKASIKPSFLQNRFHRETGYDAPLRDFCRESGITYQSFWTLTANPHIVNGPLVSELAGKYGKTPAQIWFAFVRSQGILPLTGTTSHEHMAQDLEVPSIVLQGDEVDAIKKLLK